MLNYRMTTILRELMAADTAITSQYLAKVTDVTSRTTRDDIKHLDELLEGAKIDSIRAKGYQLDIQDNQRFLHYLKKVYQEQVVTDSIIPNSPEERIRYMIKRLLLEDSYIKLEDLSEDMHISKSTIQNDLKRVKKILKKYDIDMDKRPNYGLKLQGSELKLRFCMSEYVFDRAKKAEASNEIRTDQLFSLTETELSVIWTIMIEEIQENEITPSDIAIKNLYIHIAIACKRIKSGNHVSIYKANLEEIRNQKEYNVADRIVAKVEYCLQLTFPHEEVAYIAIHLMGTKMISQTNMNEEKIRDFLDEDIQQVTLAILNKIEEKFDLGIRHDRELIVGLALHLKPAINRYRYGMNIRNPMIDDIKANYPLVFETGIVASMVLEEVMGVTIDENEIGYLALHIGAAIERRKMKKGPKRCLIVCASGFGSAQLLKYKLQSEFDSKLEIAATTEYYKLQQCSLENIDFIVSSIPIPDSLPIPVIEVNTILGENDLERIKTMVFKNSISLFDYVKESLVFLDQPFSTQEQVLNFLYDELRNKGLVHHGFLKALYEREAVAPTAFGNLVAVPHPITPLSEQTFLTFCTLKRPIEWGEKRVQFICLLSVKKDSTEDLQSMYEMLGKIIDDVSLVEDLIRSKSCSEFIKLLVPK
ncbi:BglG family transcription antiterminator [Halobacillus shinanisalinarum]|uniref:BglG family transcription antiterminator n=1 Tax=Halobacillus shinanisalinarum TaxID=2932258 RepID=A0ABY4H2L2_9BACI|nr:BglG family transcription antiterminator [Halobacillus shinanisalinarum]UOQ94584.1 BglG family transcription antiterminator [Halobacillus shinanisalinarum]